MLYEIVKYTYKFLLNIHNWKYEFLCHKEIYKHYDMILRTKDSSESKTRFLNHCYMIAVTFFEHLHVDHEKEARNRIKILKGLLSKVLS